MLEHKAIFKNYNSEQHCLKNCNLDEQGLYNTN